VDWGEAPFFVSKSVASVGEDGVPRREGPSLLPLVSWAPPPPLVSKSDPPLANGRTLAGHGAGEGAGRSRDRPPPALVAHTSTRTSLDPCGDESLPGITVNRTYQLTPSGLASP